MPSQQRYSIKSKRRTLYYAKSTVSFHVLIALGFNIQENLGSRVPSPKCSLCTKTVQSNQQHCVYEFYGSASHSLCFDLSFKPSTRSLIHTCVICLLHRALPFANFAKALDLSSCDNNESFAQEMLDDMGNDKHVCVVKNKGNLKFLHPCIHQTQSLSSKVIMQRLEQDFAHFGYPHTIASDNATTFTSEEFQEFCNERGIYHLTGASYHPATNGSAERLVQSFKQSLKKSCLPRKEALQEFLLQYRRTPLSTGYSPSELLNGRQIRAKIDVIIPSLAHIAQAQQVQVSSQLNKGKTLIDKVFKYQIGTPCYALYCGPRRDREQRWVPVIVKAVQGQRSVSVKVIPKGPVWRRHLDQSQPRHGADQDDDLGLRAKPAQELPTIEESCKKPKRRNPRLPNSDEYGPGRLRRPKRLQEKRQASAVGATGP